MDTLLIQSLSIQTQIGVYAWEQQIKQQVLIDISIPSDFSSCEEDITQTLDYDALCKTITAFVESNSFQLIESLANRVAQLIQQEFQVKELTVAVSKPHAVKNAGMVKVGVTRTV